MTVHWVSRAQSGLALPDVSRLSVRRDRIVGITKHHSGSAAPNTPSASLALWRDLQAEAMSGANVNHTRYGDIEYNVGFDNFGQVLVGRDNYWTGAHALSNGNIANRLTLGICYLGGANGDEPRPKAMEALAAIFFVVSHSIGHQALDFTHAGWARAGGIVTGCPGRVLLTSKP